MDIKCDACETVIKDEDIDYVFNEDFYELPIDCIACPKCGRIGFMDYIEED